MMQELLLAVEQSVCNIRSFCPVNHEMFSVVGADQLDDAHESRESCELFYPKCHKTVKERC